MQSDTKAFFSRFFRQITQRLEKAVPGSATLFPNSEQTGAEGLPSRGLCQSMQHYPLPEDEKAVVGQPLVHMAAHVQVSMGLQAADTFAAEVVCLRLE